MPHFKTKTLSVQLWTAFGGTLISMGGMHAAHAQSDTVYVTGSAIKRSLESQKALPVSVFSVDELKSIGVTSTQEIVQRITASQSSMGGSQSVGSSTGGRANADMRSLGASKTLVLLNGRRLAFFGIGSDTVDLNSIPFAALEKVEVLRDGASAIYGTDAVGGVINFITQRDYQGANIATELIQPSASGGASQRVTLSGGKGSLREDGYNLWFSLDSKKQNSVSALERDFAKTGIIPDKGLNKTSGTTFPANFGYYRLSDGKQMSGNLTGTNCAPPASVYMGGTTCRYDYTSAIDIIPKNENTNFMGKGSFRLGDDHLMTLEAVHSTNKNVSRVAPDPVTGLTMPTTSPFYPGTFAGIDPTRGLVSIGWRMVPGGQRETTAESSATRLMADLSGSLGDWDYKSGVYHSESKITESLTNGYMNKPLIQAGINSGLLNPFGANSADALQYIGQAQATGLMTSGKGTATGIDAQFNRQLFALNGGNAAISLGGELRREGYTTDTVDDIVNNVPSAGRSPYHVNNASRNVTAVSAELLLPISKQLELQAAARYDRYSDFGSTLNPKIGFRYTASPEVVLRGSTNTGFRAPSLDNVFGPQQVTFTQNVYDDPVLCPNGVPTSNAVEARDCGQQAQAKQGGNPNLKPEKSQSFSLGTAFQPAKNLLFTLDYWNIKLNNYITTFPEQAIFADPVKYANRIVRCSQVSSAEAANLSRCDVAGSPGIAYITTLTDNLGSVKTDGLDFTAAWQTETALGRVNVNYEGTYVHSYKFQREAGSTFIQNAGAYKDFLPGVVFRWKHNVTTTLASGDMSYSLGMRYLSGYQDENLDPDFINRVSAYTVFDLGASYTGIKNLTLGAVVRNLLDVKPPFSNQGSTFQQGYDPRYTDPLGRSIVLKLNYKFS